MIGSTRASVGTARAGALRAPFRGCEAITNAAREIERGHGNQNGQPMIAHAAAIASPPAISNGTGSYWVRLIVMTPVAQPIRNQATRGYCIGFVKGKRGS